MRLAERTMATLAERLRVEGVSHADAASMTGRSKAYVQRRLSGTVTPNLTDLEQFAACAGMDVHIEFVPRDAPA
jgi:hypothetical protein